MFLQEHTIPQVAVTAPDLKLLLAFDPVVTIFIFLNIYNKLKQCANNLLYNMLSLSIRQKGKEGKGQWLKGLRLEAIVVTCCNHFFSFFF